MDYDQAKQLPYTERKYRRKRIRQLAAQYKYAVDKVHDGVCRYDNLSMEERADFAIYFLLAEGIPYEYPGME